VALSPLHVYPLVVHWHRRDFCPGCLERTQRFGIARVFEPSRIAGVKKQPGGQIECLLGARSDDDLLSVATHSARSANVLCDRVSPTFLFVTAIASSGMVGMVVATNAPAPTRIST